MLNDKTFLITGASSGIGKSLALMLADLGATLILLGSHEKALETVFDEIKSKGKATPYICTFNLETAVTKEYELLAEMLEENDISLNGLIHCAGQLKSLTPLEHTSLHQWHKLIQINLNARFALTKTCLPFLKKPSQAQILFLVSDKAFEKGQAHWGTYQVTEKATLTLFEILCEELAQTPIKVNLLRSAPVDTKLRRQAYPFEEKSSLLTADGLCDTWMRCFDDGLQHGEIVNNPSLALSGVA